MNRYNETRVSYFGYGIIALVMGFVTYFFVSLFARLIMALGMILYRYWWGALGVIALLIFLKRRKKK